MKTVFLFILLSVAPCFAFDIMMINGTKYQNIKLREKTDLGIKVYHDSGVAFIDYLTLSESDKTTFGYQADLYNAAKREAAGGTYQAPPIEPQQVPVTQLANNSQGYVPKYSSPKPVPVSMTYDGNLF